MHIVREEITSSRVVITGKTKRRGRIFEASGPVAHGNFWGCLDTADRGQSEYSHQFNTSTAINFIESPVIIQRISRV